MGRQTTRSKKRRNAEDGDNTPRILRRIHLTGEITHEDICELYSINKPHCQGCRVNSKDSPNCFCCLVPSSNGARKTGLWQKLSDLMYSLLGPDPWEDHRTPTEKPAGLTNFYGTCYANSILQCLYMNIPFRAGIFSVESDLLKQNPVLDQLTRLFALLHSSQNAVVDSLPFVKTLELEKCDQQDSHEFLTLFLSLLERSLSHSKVSKARTLVQDLFRGSLSHVTRCSVCENDSEASSNIDDFYGLELNIKGLENLDASLDDYLNVEQLSGENQYFCQSCGKRVDATHCIKLHALPPVLIFQLKRYDFLMKMTKRKKIASPFSFPSQLNMGRRLDDISKPELLYNLSAMLIHKGAAATSGHYVARIKDENSGDWWEFDDQTVRKLGHQPFREVSSNSSASGQPAVQSEKLFPASNEKRTSGFSKSGNHEIFSLTDAYMLIYNCTRAQKDAVRSEKTSESDAKDADILRFENISLPTHLSEEVKDFDSPFVKNCLEYQSKKDFLVAHITERRREVKAVLSEACVHSVEDPFFWVSADWLRQWADNFDLPWTGNTDLLRVDNSSIQCSHGKVSVAKVSHMKRISTGAWSKLLSMHGGGPTLSSDDYCIECLKEEALNFVSADGYRGRMAAMKQLAEAALAGKCTNGKLYYVSKTWLGHWLHRKKADNPCDADPGPTASLRCSHGNLLPEEAPGAKRVHVPESLWLFLLESANAVKRDDLPGCQVFHSDSQPCEICYKELLEAASHAGSLRQLKLREQQSHELLFSGKSINLYPGEKYFLVPSSWLTKWRGYVRTTRKNSSSVKPECLELIVNSLKCEKHGRLLERPLGLVYKGGLLTQNFSNVDGLTLIPESDWKLFCLEWDAIEEKGISAQIVCITDQVVESSEGIPIVEGDLKCSNDAVSSELVSKDLIIKTNPEICEDCIRERDSRELMHKLNYSSEEISVHLIRGKEVPISLLEASTNISGPDRRTSKRSRSTLSGKVCKLRVSGTMSVYQLKTMIWEYFGVVKGNQKLHKGFMEIDGDSTTLAENNIFPGDALWVTDSEIHENRNIADELSGQKFESDQAREGFHGTLLLSDASIQDKNDTAISRSHLR